jgi:hypothetical protein
MTLKITVIKLSNSYCPLVAEYTYIPLTTLSTLIFDGLLDRMGGVQEVGVHEGAGVLLGRGQLQDLHRQREAGGGQVQPDGRARA